MVSKDGGDGGAKQQVIHMHDQGTIYRLASRVIQQDKNYGRYYTILPTSVNNN